MPPPQTKPSGARSLSNEPSYRPKQHEQHQARRPLASVNAVAATFPQLTQSSRNNLDGWGMQSVGEHNRTSGFRQMAAPRSRGYDPVSRKTGPPQSVNDPRGHRAPPAVPNPLAAAAAVAPRTITSADGGDPSFGVDGDWSVAPFSTPGPGPGNYAAVVDHSYVSAPGPGLLVPTQRLGMEVGMFRSEPESQNEHWTAGLQQPKYAARLGSHGLFTNDRNLDRSHANAWQSQAMPPACAPLRTTDDRNGGRTRGQASGWEPLRDFNEPASLDSSPGWDDHTLLSEFVDDTATPPVFVDPTMSKLPGRASWPLHTEAVPIRDRPAKGSSVHHHTLHFAPDDTADYGKSAYCLEVGFETLLTSWRIRCLIRTAILQRKIIVWQPRNGRT